MGREPNKDGLGLENNDVKVSDRGEILVDEYLETKISGIYAVGDV
ncbi:FAD-dependent oxidoreductase [Streptobacillus felis]